MHTKNEDLIARIRHALKRDYRELTPDETDKLTKFLGV